MICAPNKFMIVELVRPEEKKGVIIMPEKREYNIGRVINVGPGCSASVVEGCYVYFGLHSGRMVTYRGKEYCSVFDDHLFAITDEL